MIAASKLSDTDLVFIDSSLYGPAGRTADGWVILAHECPDGQVRSIEVEPWDEFVLAGERLTELRGALDDTQRRLDNAVYRANRAGVSDLRRNVAAGLVRMLRQQRDKTQAQIAELEDLGVVATLILGAPNRCPDCRGSGLAGEDEDVCPTCWASGLGDG